MLHPVAILSSPGKGMPALIWQGNDASQHVLLPQASCIVAQLQELKRNYKGTGGPAQQFRIKV